MSWDYERLSRIEGSLHPLRHRARELAARHREVGLAHLTAALFERREVRGAISAIGLDLDEVSCVVLGTLDEQRRRAWWQLGGPDESPALLHVYEHALTHAYSAELEEVSPISVLVWALIESTSCVVAERLEALDVLPLPLKLYDAHGIVRDEPLPDGAGAVRVVLHNDPYTTMELVTEVLVECFDLAPEVAERTMLAIHRSGRGELRFASWAEGRRRAEEARAQARASEAPLHLTLE